MLCGVVLIIFVLFAPFIVVSCIYNSFFCETTFRNNISIPDEFCTSIIERNTVYFFRLINIDDFSFNIFTFNDPFCTAVLIYMYKHEVFTNLQAVIYGIRTIYVRLAYKFATRPNRFYRPLTT